MVIIVITIRNKKQLYLTFNGSTIFCTSIITIRCNLNGDYFVSGYSCTHITVGQAWICKGLPEEYRGALASPGEKEAGVGDLCHSS